MSQGANIFAQQLSSQAQVDSPVESGFREIRSPTDISSAASQQQVTSPQLQHSDKIQQVMELLDTSYRNMPAPFDQDAKDPKHPVPIDNEDHMFPTVPMFNRRENFAKFDESTLFFAFYHQQGTYQQYQAAIELKKQNWKFHKKFKTWFKKYSDASQPSSQPEKVILPYYNTYSGWPESQVHVF
jgi:CCR4-NOT transcriptional regulation complex NOT5 subunit